MIRRMRKIYSKELIVFITVLMILLLPLSPFTTGKTKGKIGTHASNLTLVDVDLPSNSTGSSTGTLAVRIYTPTHTRYQDGAPVLIYVPGGDSRGGLRNCLPSVGDDLVTIYFIFPGGNDPQSGRSSDGVYDHRGLNCILALRDVILYAAGKITDSLGRTIDEILPIPILHNNIGLLGVSNGGNIVVAVAALHDTELADYLRYVIQWESPVSSQIATVDLGPIRFNCSPNDFVNPRYLAYDPLTLVVDYSDLAYDSTNSQVPIFHDGNGDGHYTTILHPITGLPTPDLDLDGELETNEDFPLWSYTYTDGTKDVYSRPVTHALADNAIFSVWPSDIATPEEADTYWDLREAVRLYDEALINIPDLHGMILASVKDHVQSAPDKPHIHQAFDGWNSNNAWVKINPSPSYLIEVDPTLIGRTDLPDNIPNIPPSNWSDYNYCIPEDIPDSIYQLAAIWEMADRTYNNQWYTLEIKNIRGGFGISAIVKNIGREDILDAQWSIDVSGLVFIGSHTEGTTSIPAGGEGTIKSGFILGIGPATVTINVGGTTKTASCFVLGSLVLV
ncbi:MAG: hypothetical protein FE048_01625 [Thermoplasmata archaeon]|nr:MAG: hypothetical protein FE048_01625 [Thermoplasmata archaeon]